MKTCRIGSIGIGEGYPVRLMGIINCSPESFFQGSWIQPGRVREAAHQMIDAGADIIDIGARSTAPGSRQITVAEECDRLKRALNELEGSGLVISVDTMQKEVLEVALRYEISAINDIHGLADEGYASIAEDSGLPVIAMAAISEPGDACGADETLQALALVLDRCREHGIEEIILDPGIGRWVSKRSFGDDWDICRRFSEFTTFGYPLLGAISRKSFIGDLLGRPVEDRLSGSIALQALLIMRGASIIRSHDIQETVDTIRVCDVMERGTL